MMPASSSPNPILEMLQISKSYGSTQALEGVDFNLRKGEVHALIGENGAGKSTLVKVLSGAVRPDEGKILLHGTPFIPASPLDSRRRGISMIYQELNLAPHLTVEANIMLGKEKRRGIFLNRDEMRQAAREALALVRHSEIDLNSPVQNLSIGNKQIVEIARALVERASILIMDEPTSSLSLEDTRRLFKVIARLKEEGVSLIYISHFLEEVQEVTDRYTVLLDGRRIKTAPIGSTSLDELIQLMVGQKLGAIYPRIPHEVGKRILHLDDFQGKHMQAPLNLSLHQGEILGFAGLVGAGRTDVVRSVFGLEAVRKGFLVVAGLSSTRAFPWTRIQQGMGFLSEDRQREGLALSRSVADNIALSRFGPYSSSGFLHLKKYESSIKGLLSRMNIKAEGPGQPVSALSGGNQQKVAMSRLFHQEADILLLDEPTRGIDVVSKAQIYGWMGELAAEGKAIIFISSYLPELLGVCDSIAVFHRGRIIDQRPARDWDAPAIMAAATLGRL